MPSKGCNITNMVGACEYPHHKYKQEKKKEEIEKEESKRLNIIRLITMTAILISIAWLKMIPSTWLSDTIVVITVIIGGYSIFKESFLALKKGRVNMELSMVIAIIASLLLLQILPAMAITFFALLSEFIGVHCRKRQKKYRNTLQKCSKKSICTTRKKR